VVSRLKPDMLYTKDMSLMFLDIRCDLSLREDLTPTFSRKVTGFDPDLCLALI